MVTVARFTPGSGAGAAAPTGGNRENPTWLAGFSLPVSLLAPALRSSWPKGIHRGKSDPGLVEPGSLSTAPSSLVPVGLFTLGGGAGAGTPMGGSRGYTARPAGMVVPSLPLASPISMVTVARLIPGRGASAAVPTAGTRKNPTWPTGLIAPRSLLAAAPFLLAVALLLLKGGAGDTEPMGAILERSAKATGLRIFPYFPSFTASP